jgi:hypothetical protein
VPQWEKEIGRLYPDAVLICAHGGTNLRNEWVLEVDGAPSVSAKTMAKIAKAFFPGKRIFFVSCNEDALTLDEPGVFYSRRIVAANPNRSWPGWANRVEDFTEGLKCSATPPSSRPSR